jgi:hypothetical protein
MTVRGSLRTSRFVHPQPLYPSELSPQLHSPFISHPSRPSTKYCGYYYNAVAHNDASLILQKKVRCLLSQKLSVKALVDLAETEFSSCRVPAKAFFRHHPSIEPLEASANSGCDLCQLIRRGLEETVMPETDSDSDDSNTFRASKRRTVLDHARALVNRLDFKIQINTDHVCRRHRPLLGCRDAGIA